MLSGPHKASSTPCTLSMSVLIYCLCFTWLQLCTHCRPAKQFLYWHPPAKQRLTHSSGSPHVDCKLTYSQCCSVPSPEPVPDDDSVIDAARRLQAREAQGSNNMTEKKSQSFAWSAKMVEKTICDDSCHKAVGHWLPCLTALLMYSPLVQSVHTMCCHPW